MELNTLSKKELIEEVERLRAENTKLKKDNNEVWDTVKILVTKISHEMKTPLNSIIGFSELFMDKTENLTLKNYIKNILKSSYFMLELIQNMIDITGFKNNTLTLSYSIFNTKDAIEEIISQFNNNSIQYTLINTTICADYTRFKQVIYNLLSNAIKYNSTEKNIEIITYLEKKLFCFEITDYGEGIEERDKEKIFEIFTQVSKNNKKRNLGLGLGLALCKKIATSHRGKIEIISKAGQGSTFIFKIPITQNLI